MELKVINTEKEYNERQIKHLKKEYVKNNCFLIAAKNKNLRNCVYWGIVATNTHHKELGREFIFSIYELIQTLTYKQFIEIFPIDKDYDGKGNWKDYFTTIEYLKNKDLNKVIGENAYNFLSNYHNHRVLIFLVDLQMSIDELYEEITGINPFDEFIAENNIPTYTMHEVDGKKFLMDSNGKTIPIKKKTNLKVIK